MNKLPITATVICYNEAHNLPRLLKSLDFVSEIVVVDSFSQDESVKIAESFGAKVFQNSFVGFGQQKNFAAGQAQFEWVLSLDADEEVTDELKKSLAAALEQPLSSVYELGRKTFFLGQFIRYGGWYPDRVARFYQKSKARFTEPQVHEVLIANDGLAPARLAGELNHYSFPTVESQILRNMKYAKLGAKHLLEKKGRVSMLSVITRPPWKFVECYILKLGFLDGIAGLIIALNAAYSMFMKYSFAYFGFEKTRNRIGE